MRRRVLGQPIDVVDVKESLYLSKVALYLPRQFKIVTLNPEMVVIAEKNPEFQAAINNANFIIPDGIGIVWALKIAGFQEAVRIPGIELSEQILEYANELKKKKVALFGGGKTTLEKLIKIFSDKYPNIEIVKAIDGFQGKEEDKRIAEEIANENPDIVLVALGTPRQEIWINKYEYLFSKSLMLGVGGSFDVWSGEKERAPEWIRKFNLEWFYRVACEPKRISRLFSTLPRFFLMILKDTLYLRSKKC